MSWDILPKNRIQYIFEKLKTVINNGTLTIQKNGVTVQTFGANESSDKTADIVVPTKTSDLTNDSNYATEDDVTDATEVETLADTTPYLYRQSPAIGTRVMENALVGCSFGVNQLISHGNFDATTDWSGDGASLSVSNNVGTMTFTSATGKVKHNINAIANHVYLTFATLRANDTTSLPTLASYIGSSGIFKYVRTNVTTFQTVYILEKQSTVFSVPQIQIRNAQNPLPSDTTVQAKNVYTIDLTQWFASDPSIADNAYTKEQATAGSGIAWLKSQGHDFSEYIDYNTGTLESVNPSAKKVVGKNQANPILNGYYDATGFVSDDRWTACELVKCLPNETYTLSNNVNLGGNIFFYDGNMSYISYVTTGNTPKTFATPSNAYYMGIYGRNLGNCQLEFGSQSTAFEPYTEKTYSISQSPLRGVPTLVNDAIVYEGDVRKSDGSTDRKYIECDLGTLNWSRDTSKSHPFFYTDSLTGIIKHVYGSQNYNHPILCAKYFVLTTISVSASDSEWADASFNKSMVYHSNPTKEYIYIRDDSYTDAATFKNAMSGVYLVYELATPTTENLPPYTNPQKSFVGGTEEWLTENDIPVGHDSEYKALPAEWDDDYMVWLQEQAEEVQNKADKEMEYLQIMDNNVATDLDNYRIYFHMISSPYALVNKAEMLSHRFLFVELFYNNGTQTNRRIISSALIDPNSLDGYYYEIEISNNDTLNIESYPDTDEFAITLFTTGSYNDGDPTDYYLTIRLVD